MMEKDEIIRNLKSAEAVFIIVDRTLCPDDGLYELARFHGVEADLERITEQQNRGNLTFNEALVAKIEAINPTYMRLKTFLLQREPQIISGAKDLIEELRKRGAHIYLLSAGLAEIASAPAKMIGVPREDIHANKLLYYYTGQCIGIDNTLPMSKSDGIATVIQSLKKKFGYSKVVLIGRHSSATTSPPVGAFIRLKDQVTEDRSKSKIGWSVENFNAILSVLKE